MKQETDRYFTEMQKVLVEYTNARKQRYDERTTLTKTGNLEALKAWDEREETIARPYSPGFMTAYWAWMDNREKENDLFEVTDLPVKEDVHDFISCFRKADITEFAVTDQSTALMESLHRFSEEGCTLKGLCKVHREEKHWGEKQTVVHEGIMLEIH